MTCEWNLTLREAALVLGVLSPVFGGLVEIVQRYVWLLLLAQAAYIEVAQNGDRPSPGVAVRTPSCRTVDGAFAERQSA
jgi:hypothetical protein